MEKQINVGNQNGQQIGQNPVSQSPQITEKSKVNYWMISTVISSIVIVFGSLYIFNLKNQLNANNSTINKQPNSQQGSSVLPTNIPNPTRSTSLEFTSSWETYKNTQYQFSFKYPNGWTVSDRNTYYLADGTKSEDNDPNRPWLLKEVSIMHSDKNQNVGGPWMHIAISNESLPVALKRTENDISSGSNQLFVKSKTTEEINGNVWTKIEWDNKESLGNGGRFYLITKNNITYNFSCNYPTKEEKECLGVLDTSIFTN